MMWRWVLVFALVAGVAACTSGSARDQPSVVPRTAVLSPAVPAAPPIAVPVSFPEWLAAFEQEARGEGISEATLDRAFTGLQPIPRVIELDHRQPEVKLTFDDYIHKIVSDTRVGAAQRHMVEDHALLSAVSRRYGVQAPYIVALWGDGDEFRRTDR